MGPCSVSAWNRVPNLLASGVFSEVWQGVGLWRVGSPVVGSLGLCLSLLVERYSLLAGVKWLSLCVVQFLDAVSGSLFCEQAGASVSGPGFLVGEKTHSPGC